MLRKQTDETNPGDWFAFGAERLRGADILWREGGVSGLGIEALQEGVERYLKGFLIAKGWTLVKTHDLEQLVREAVVFDPAFERFVPLAIELTEDFSRINHNMIVRDAVKRHLPSTIPEKIPRMSARIMKHYGARQENLSV
jgi:HEPN domain-containing protein